MKVLFVCQANSARSQMAEALYNHLSGTQDATSAGTEADPDRAVNLPSAEAMALIGIDISHHKRRKLTRGMVEAADKVVALVENEPLPGYLKDSPKLEIWPTHDPHELDGHVAARNDIRHRVEELIKRGV